MRRTTPPLSRLLLACTLSVPLALLAQPEVEPNNSLGQANPITEGTPFSGETGACAVPDNSLDHFTLVTSGNGAIRIRSEMSSSDAAPIVVSIDLLNSFGGLVQNLQLNAGANGVSVLDSATVDCRGQGLYYLRVNNPSTTTCTSYELTVDVLPPVFGQDPEPNNALGQATPLPIATPLDGQVNFLTYTDLLDHYRLETPDDGILNFTLEAEHRGSSAGSLTLSLLSSTGGLLESYTGVTVGANSTPVTTQLSSLCRGDGLYYLRIDNASCGTSYRLSYTISAPFYAEDPEDNDSPGQADTVLAGLDHEGRLDFFYDDNSDYYRLILPDDGVLNIEVNAEHAGASSGETLTAQVLNNSGSLVQSHTVNVGANGSPITTDLITSCLGNEQLYYLRLFNPTTCGVSYQFSYDVSVPVYADDLEPNNGTAQADTVAAGALQEGRLDFNYDDNTDYYRLVLPTDGVLNITVDAEQAGSNGTDSLTVTLLNSSGGLLSNWKVGVGPNSVPNTQVIDRACLGNEQLYYLVLGNSTACGTSYRFSYSVTPPLYADDLEENDGTSQADTVAAGVDHDGRLAFFYDDNSDYYRLILPTDGVLNISLSAEHVGPATGQTVTVNLLNSSGGLLQNWTANVGANGTPASQVLSIPCRGNEQLYYLHITNSTACGTSYRFNYGVTPPVFADDAEPNQGAGQAILIDPEAASADGRLNFFYDNTDDWYRVDLAAAGTLTLNIEAENADAAGTMNLVLLNAFGGFLQQQNLTVGGNSTPVLGTFTSNALTAGTYYFRLESAPCGTSYRILCNDDDGDGTCNAFDLCPGGPEPGTPCDDLSACTTNDVIQADCSCAGTPVDPDDGDPCTLDTCDPVLGVINTFQDSDGDGTCDANDLCPGSPEPGQACDDGSLCTVNDVIDANCNCVGTPVDPDDGDPCTLDTCDPLTGVSNVFQDADGDGTCDANDVCPGSPEPGQACDDGDANTINDVVDANCVCAGTPLTVDCEGTPGGSALPGTPCDDLDANTVNDTWDANCNCVGQVIDCEGNAGGPALPGTPCDDNSLCTTNDTWDANCNCTGTPVDPDDGDPCTLDTCDPLTGVSNVFQDADGDGTCDANDVCPGSPEPGQACDDGDANTINDVVDANCVCAGTPLTVDCEGTPGGSALPGTPCDDLDANTVNDTWDANCNCVGTPVGNCTEDVFLTLFTDGAGSETSWAILPDGGGAPLCSGAGYPDNSTITENCCLPIGCYRLEVYDSFGDGMGNGGYVLTNDLGERIIDNSFGGDFGALSALALNGSFCLPLSDDRIRDSHLGGGFGCDRMDHLPGDYFVAQPNPAVVPANGDGYQFWIFDPNGSYTRRVLQSGTVNNGWPNTDPDDACYLKFSNLNTLPVPLDLPLNIRVRTRINGTFGSFGPACRAMVLGTPPACPTTRLIDDPGHPDFSCGVVREFGSSDKVVAFPVPGANRYRFRFENAGEGFLRNIAGPSPARILNWNTLPLQDGVTYEVTVAVSFDGGANWCPFGPACDVTIMGPGMFAGRDLVEELSEGPVLSLWPNPVREEVLRVRLDGLRPETKRLTLDVHDLYGKRILGLEFEQAGERFDQVLDLGDDLAPGMYLMTIQVDGQAYTQRFVKQ